MADRGVPGGPAGASGRANTPSRSEATLAYARLVDLLKCQWIGRNSRIHPETRKTLERVLDRLTALDLGDDPNALREADVGRIVGSHGWLASSKKPSEEQAWALADSLHVVWIRTADKAAIDAEFARLGESNSLDDENKRAFLLSRHSALRQAGAHERARAALRSKYLRAAGGLLTALIIMAWLVALSATGDRSTITLCALAGGVGGALSGARSMRDSSGIHIARVFQTWWYVQPAVGAAVGLFVYALLASSVLTLPGSASTDATTEAAARIVYAFMAGFSEPWILRVMERLGGTADKAATTAMEQSAALGTVTAATPPLQ